MCHYEVVEELGPCFAVSKRLRVPRIYDSAEYRRKSTKKQVAGGDLPRIEARNELFAFSVTVFACKGACYCELVHMTGQLYT